MLYKHWKKIVLALTGFFWASCDETASGPVNVNEDGKSSSITETEGTSSSSKAKSAASSAEKTSAASSAERSSSSKAKSAASSVEEAGSEEASAASSAEETSKSSSSKTVSATSSEAAASAESSTEASSAASSAQSAESETSNATEPGSEASSSSAKSSSSSKKHHRSSSSALDEPVDLYGCPSDICGPFITDSVSISDSISIIAAKYGVILPESSSSFSQIAAKYGVILPESSSSLTQIIAKYGVPSKPTCEPTKSKDGTVTYECSDGVTCVEETTTEMQPPPCEGDVCPKYGVVKISKKTYTCSNGQVYNEAEFQMLYDALPAIEGPIVIKDSIQAPIALYGPPCVFDGTCDKEK